MPQPNLVPVSPSVSRSTQRSGVSGVTLTVSRLPLTVKLVGGMTGRPRGRWKKRVQADARREGVPSGTVASLDTSGARDSARGGRITRPKRLSGRLLTSSAMGSISSPVSPSAPRSFPRRRFMDVLVRWYSTPHPHSEGTRMALVRRLVPALVAVLFWAVPLGAQESPGAVTGKVVDITTQQPLANVEVAIAGTPHREISRGDGSFTLNGIPAGAYRLRASRIAYGSQVPEVTRPPRGAPTVPG